MENLDRTCFKGVSGVYAIKDINRERVYIGSSVCLYKRINGHLCELKKNKHSNCFLQNHFNKYGNDSLVVEILETGKYNSLKELRDREQFYLDIYYNTNCFNAHNKVDYFNDNIRATNKLSEIVKLNWKNNYSTLKEIVINNLNIARESRNRKLLTGELIIISSMRGKKHKEESKIKMSMSAKKRGIQLNTSKEIYQYNMNGQYINSFPSMKEATRSLSLKEEFSTNIGKCASYERSRAYNYIWRFFKVNYIELPFLLIDINSNNILQFLDFSLIAKYLSCNPSTISRAFHNKSIIFNKYIIKENKEYVYSRGDTIIKKQ